MAEKVMTQPLPSDLAAFATPPDPADGHETRSGNAPVEAGPDRARQMIDAASELLLEGGLEGLTIRAVLKKTGLARRAFYERFAGKDDLMLAVFEHTIRLAAVHYAEQVSVIHDPLERLKYIVTSIGLGTSTSDGADSELNSRRGAAMSREHMRLAESRPDDLQAALSPLMMLIAQELSEGMNAGSVRECSPQRLATLVYNLVSTTVHTELLAEESGRPARRHELAADIWEFCRRAIAA